MLIAPRWKKAEARIYLSGKFEPIKSALSQPVALAEQIIAEVASGLSRSPQQLSSTFSASLAAWQQKLPDVEAITEQMLEAGMLYCPDTNKGEDTDKLKVTKLGWVAVAKLKFSPRRYGTFSSPIWT
ncbi:MAG TPA: hypothetical protein DCE56_39625 [Cyanobacteria bacterium UBA8553]|nr:hypothetical protein [Cyanobacteria bacterium UBA8553]HAJ63369.1 hypothetical protein [Cyanobacteria bacterium UBA8543]